MAHHMSDPDSYTDEQKWDCSGKYLTVRDRFPGVPPGAPLQALIWNTYTIVADVCVPFLNRRGEWRISRDPLNDRGDESTVQRHCENIKNVGLYLGIRGGGWLFPAGDTDVVSDETMYFAIHFASLNEGVKRAHEEDTTNGKFV